MVLLTKVVGILFVSFCILKYTKMLATFLSSNGMVNITRLKFSGNISYSSHAYKQVIIRLTFSAKIYYLLMLTRKVGPCKYRLSISELSKNVTMSEIIKKVYVLYCEYLALLVCTEWHIIMLTHHCVRIVIGFLR